MPRGMAWGVVPVVVESWSAESCGGLYSRVEWWVTRIPDLGPGLRIWSSTWRCGTAGGGWCKSPGVVTTPIRRLWW